MIPDVMRLMIIGWRRARYNARIIRLWRWAWLLLVVFSTAFVSLHHPADAAPTPPDPAFVWRQQRAWTRLCPRYVTRKSVMGWLDHQLPDITACLLGQCQPDNIKWWWWWRWGMIKIWWASVKKAKTSSTSSSSSSTSPATLLLESINIQLNQTLRAFLQCQIVTV